MIGKVFSQLTVVSFIEKRNSTKVWLCRCSCGEMVNVRQCHLVTSHTRSCGCLKIKTISKTFTKHGALKNGALPRTYTTWRSMLDRCNNEKNSHYKHYGARGIKVCDEWLKEYSNFLADMGEKPAGLSLDRIDHNGNYEKANCRWTTTRIQAVNRRKRSNCTSSYVGVFKHPKNNRWESYCDGERIGSFKLEKDAAKAYNARALEVFGSNANLNKLED